MTCPDCARTVDDLPIGEPCPNCGSLRRDATVGQPELEVMTQLFPAIVSASIDTLIAIPEVKQVVDDHEITLRFTPPSRPDAGWLLEARDGDDLIAFVPAPEMDDVDLATADEIEAAVHPEDKPE